MPCGWPAVSVAAHQLGITITPGGVTQALARTARRLQPTDAALIGGVQASPVMAPDETGWRVGGQRAWLWPFTGGRERLVSVLATAETALDQQPW